MKNKIYIIFTILLSILCINIVNATEEIITYNRTVNYNIEHINNIIGKKEGYIILENTSLNKTIIHNYDNNDKKISSKELENLSNSTITKYNEYYLVVGIKSNTLKVYLIDSNLQVINQQDTSYIINKSTTFSLYQSDNKILIILTEEGELSSNNIYEVNETLNISEKRFSSYEGNHLKTILKSDYYLISNNNIETNNRLINYKKSTYNEEKIILVGSSTNILYDINNENNEQAHLTIRDYKDNILIDKDIEKYDNFKDIELLKDNLIILATRDFESFLCIYDLEGNFINEIKINNINITEPDSLYKVGNQLVLKREKNYELNQLTNNLDFYLFSCEIINEENIFGTTEVATLANPYETITLKVTPNSGYEVESIVVKDSQGNILEVNNNTFVMPENDVTIVTNYKENLTNPETFDYIFIIIVLTITTIIISIKMYKKLRWLK